MATISTVLLSSSPPLSSKPFHHAPEHGSSSPALPSPSQIYSSMPARSLHSSHIALNSAQTNADFASATKVEYDQEHPEDRRTINTFSAIHDNVSRPSKTAHSADRLHRGEAKPFKLLGVLDTPQGSELPRQGQCKGLSSKKEVEGKAKSLNEAQGNPLTKKGRKKKVDSDPNRQTRIKKPKVTKALTKDAEEKPKLAKKQSAKGKKRKSTTVSTLLADDDNSLPEPETTCRKPKQIMRKKSTWTPVRNTEDKSSARLDEENTESKRMGSLFGDYEFSVVTERGSTAQKTRTIAENCGAFKKRKIELVNGLSHAPVISKKSRSKSPRKKPQTITEKATAPFVGPGKESDTSLRRYFPERPWTEDNADTSIQGQAPRLQGENKQAKKKTTTRKATEPIVLHSPETAMQHAKSQDYLFGTSSQLARDESPDFLRNLQQAMKESEQESQSSATLNGTDMFLDISTTVKRPSRSLALTPSKNLWSAAARDLDQALLDAEVVDLTRTPNPAKLTDGARAVQHATINETVLLSKVGEGSPKFEWSDDFFAYAPDESNECSESSSSLTVETNWKHPQHSETTAPSLRDDNAGAKVNNMPNYEGYTDVELSKKIAAYGFKPMKKRTAMISLLERCWDSKSHNALKEMPNIVNRLLPNQDVLSDSSAARLIAKRKAGIQKQVGSSAKASDPNLAPRPRGRPKKDPTSAKAPSKRSTKAKPATPVQEETARKERDVFDEDAPKASSPRRGRTPWRTSVERPSSPSDIPSFTPLPAKDSAAYAQKISTSITEAVTSQPPTNNPKNLSWREKMLIYEPIVVEDLAAWLNRDGLGKVGEDDEVELWQVKKWCESRSICCLWKENLKRGQRGRW